MRSDGERENQRGLVEGRGTLPFYRPDERDDFVGVKLLWDLFTLGSRAKAHEWLGRPRRTVTAVEALDVMREQLLDLGYDPDTLTISVKRSKKGKR